MIKSVIFDLDGTIGNTIPMCIQAFKEATRPYTPHELSDEEVVQTFGLNEEGMIKCVVDACHWQQALCDFYVVYTRLHSVMCPAPFSGIIQLIEALKRNGVIVSLVTGKGKRSCYITLRQFGMTDVFDKVMTGSAERNTKSEALRVLMHTFRLSSDEVVYIGDTVSDIAECRKANVRCHTAAWSILQENVSLLEEYNAGNVFRSIPSVFDYLMTEVKRKRNG